MVDNKHLKKILFDVIGQGDKIGLNDILKRTNLDINEADEDGNTPLNFAT